MRAKCSAAARTASADRRLGCTSASRTARCRVCAQSLVIRRCVGAMELQGAQRPAVRVHDEDRHLDGTPIRPLASILERVLERGSRGSDTGSWLPSRFLRG